MEKVQILKYIIYLYTQFICFATLHTPPSTLPGLRLQKKKSLGGPAYKLKKKIFYFFSLCNLKWLHICICLKSYLLICTILVLTV